jgi:hypothetical protein
VRQLDPVDYLQIAVQAMLEGNQTEATSALQMIGHEPGSDRTSRSIPKHVEVGIYLRDRFLCRYCGKRVIFGPLLRLVSDLQPDLFPWHRNWMRGRTHPLYWTHRASCDHVRPVARGGSSDPSNLVTACYMCQDMKSHWTLEELKPLGWRLRPCPTEVSDWDGLSGLYKSLWSTASQPQQDLNHQSWVRALEQASSAMPWLSTKE